jgi:predicted dehydrogenase
MHKVGIVGCGFISQTHLRAWAGIPNFRIAGVFDLNRKLAATRAKQFRIPVLFDTLQDLYAECEVVDVCTPPQTHFEIAQTVIAANKHLVIEKPLVMDVCQWDTLLPLLRQSQTQVLVIHNLKYSSSLTQAKRWAEEGRIGEIIRLEREFLTDPTHDRMLDGNGHWSHTLPGGRWFETLPHELYLIYHFVGALQLADVRALHTPRAGVGAPADEVLITLNNANCFASIHYSSNCQQNKRTFAIQGTRGSILVDVLGDYAVLSTGQDTTLQRRLGGLVAFETAQRILGWVPNRVQYAMARASGETPHSRIIRAFASYLDGQGQHPTPLDEIDYVVRNADAIGHAISRQVGMERD